MNRLILLAMVTLLSPAADAPRSPLLPRSNAGQRQVTDNGTRPVVSPDGQWIVFGSNRDATSDLYLTNLEGSVTVRLTADTAEEGSIAWSRDGKRILYSVYDRDAAKLFSILPDGTGRMEVGHFPGRNPMLSPDGKKVIYAVGGWNDMQVVMADLDGTHARQISPPGAAYYNHRFSPDGTQVAVSRNAPSDMQVWILDAAGKAARPLTHSTEGRPQSAAWSPDGRLVAVQGTLPYPADLKKLVGNIWIVDVQTGGATTLAAHPEPYLDETPSWFPDGRRIAFQSNRTGRWEVWVMAADGTESRQITR